MNIFFIHFMTSEQAWMAGISNTGIVFPMPGADVAAQVQSVTELAQAMQTDWATTVAFFQTNFPVGLVDPAALASECFANDTLMLAGEIIYEADAGVALSDVIVEAGEALVEAAAAL